MPGPGKVLIVDDHHDAADSLKMLLDFVPDEFDVRVAYDCEPPFLDLFVNWCPAVIVLDMRMPRAAAARVGAEEAVAIRIRTLCPFAKIILLTAWTFPDCLERLKALGFVHQHLKPCEYGPLHDEILAACRTDRDRRGV